MPLPAGRVRVSKLDSADQTLEFVGEDIIDHTAQDENVRLRMGSAFILSVSADRSTSGSTPHAAR